MCGIAGFRDLYAEDGSAALARAANRMAASLTHRGPDDQGVWADPAAGIALGHRRLSILDRSVAGHQPMASADGRWILAFNGEIYNWRDLRADLEVLGRGFRSESDTEVLVEAVAEWGVEETLPRLVGMFACALWDRASRELHLVRDRLGLKPLYYGRCDGRFLFGSELKALRAHPSWTGERSPEALTSYLRFGYVPAPASIYANVFKLEPGQRLVLRENGSIRTIAYWTLREAAHRARAERDRSRRAEDVLEELDETLRAAVRDRMVADVPLGALLSGGIDSSTVVALMQAQSSRPIRTFSIGFHEGAHDEARYARAVAAHLGTDHTELQVRPREALDVIPNLADVYDEPFADSSQIPTLLVSALARRRVTVALSGDGGDEAFAGYNRHVWARRIWRATGWVPRPARTALAAFCHRWSAVLGRLPWGCARPAGRIRKAAALIAAEAADEGFRRLLSQWRDPERIACSANELRTADRDAGLREAFPDFTERMLYLDGVAYLPDDVLVKVDRASMAHGLEVRAPLLDHRVVELAWRIPLALKVRRAKGKWILRRLLHRYVPRPLVERPKMGFALPLAAWLRGDLREWAEDLLSVRSLGADGWIRPEPVRRAWQEHVSGRRNHAPRLWVVLMYELWRRRWAAASPPPLESRHHAPHPVRRQ